MLRGRRNLLFVVRVALVAMASTPAFSAVLTARKAPTSRRAPTSRTQSKRSSVRSRTRTRPKHRRRHRQPKRRKPTAKRHPFGAASQAAAPPSTAITGTTYYVSPNGSDDKSGTSPRQAWRTLYRVNKADLKPGDGVLFQGGAAFSDQALMPGWGLSVSGTPDRPVVFGSYGGGQATLTEGAWIKGESHLVFQNLNMGPHGGMTGTGDHVTVQGCTFRNFMGQEEIPVMPVGSDWLIRDNAIDRTGDSGMLLRGDHFQVYDNVITNTSLDHSITYGSHGIYLNAPNSIVSGNIIKGFRDNGVSVRYRNSTVSNNTIEGGTFGVAFFQFDPQAATSRFTGNRISGALITGIYVSPRDVAGNTRESFVISGNRIARPPAGSPIPPDTTWLALSLSHTSGTYTLSGNTVL